ncbi:hypothetical protein APS56_11920 [Pseudalgibacter alginicilyticus]|uniref:HTH luxR-type domain-containing protein n=1 Tax=Pseudalgibacter alginicilyticus TaxID=1736674 RepID=A0A0N7HYP0_9FLAO|nr:tetratricopeptide repeat protein [Pseudalgibacter alginicilyticus]ALJ05790.1 hypothetical protein APS56_11920 [Pseudalgibacter alginicilyticus]
MVSHEVKINKLKAALHRAKNLEDTLKMAQGYNHIADFYKQLGLDSEALKNYHLAQELHVKKDTFFVYTTNNIASIHHDLKQYDHARHYLEQSIMVSENIQFSKGLAVANTLLGSVFEKQGDYKKALQYQEQSLKTFKILNDSTGLAVTYESIGSIYEDLGQFNVAYSYFKKAYNYERSYTSNLKINITNNLGDVNRKRKEYEKALSYTQQALELARKTKNSQQEESALKDLARTHADLGDFEAAYRYLSNQNIVKEQDLKHQNAELVSAMQVLYNVKESEAELALLGKQNQINKTRQYAILLFSTAMCLVFIVWLIYLKKRKKQEQKILKYKQKLLRADLDIKIAEEAALKREIDIKISALTNYSLSIAHKNKILSDVSRTLKNLKSRNGEFIKSKLEGLAKDIDLDLSNKDEWAELRSFFGQIHPDFFQNLKSKVLVELSSSELRLCMLLRLNLSSKEIASILHITPDSVRIARYRMRKKLPIDSKSDLQAYLLKL